MYMCIWICNSNMVGQSIQGTDSVPLAVDFQEDPVVSYQVYPSSILFFSIRFFGSRNCKLIIMRNWKVESISFHFGFTWANLFLCTSCEA